ncbi:probable palmitoyltransferase ZDHHC24 [Drosophila subpulchrella]|uniref:probable palmitoyltransferase ZDHHC24 n=1 Tax=Drosophila subpulchrella TaxID=1486046 RepID=UPI0018A13444|nr:probable palmitoyltransferase ZDHHC24 [Drosophila subpulchrella]XP_037711199.1 probable palmitoyltransferase ZDHHC24 [Drosophila subpulchrella]
MYKKMRFRSLKKIWPKAKMERLIMTFVVCVVLAVYYILMEIVLPELSEYGTPIYIFQRVLALFCASNILSNLVMCILVDSTIDPKCMRDQLERGRNNEDWHKCDVCRILAPPRASHCNACDVCVLKRDHHCIVTGCCIGHANYRYFFYFVIYLFLSCLISLISSFIFIFVLRGGKYQFRLLRMPVPYLQKNHIGNYDFDVNSNIMEIFDLGLPGRYELVFAVAFTMICIGICGAGYMIIEHWSVIKNGSICYEFKFQNFLYDRGLRRNFESFLGRRMKWTWISAFIPSPLPQDGFHWEPTDEDEGGDDRASEKII